MSVRAALRTSTGIAQQEVLVSFMTVSAIFDSHASSLNRRSRSGRNFEERRIPTSPVDPKEANGRQYEMIVRGSGQIPCGFVLFGTLTSSEGSERQGFMLLTHDTRFAGYYVGRFFLQDAFNNVLINGIN